MKRLMTAALVAAAWSTVALAEPVFVNGLAIPGNTVDATGVPGANQGRMGFFSDLYYDSARNEWWGLSDRGPGGGTISYETRVQRFTLDVNPDTGAISNFKIVQTVKFSDASGKFFNGLAPSPSNALGLALDPEGFVVSPKTGNFLVSDEYGPSVYEFNRSGQRIRSFTTPANLVPHNASGTPNFGGDDGNTIGKRHNRGFEGLAISPDGNYAFAALQSPTLDEGGSGNGRYTRIVKFDMATGLAVAQYAYLMDRSGQGQGVSALVALNDHSFWVLERNNRGVGTGAELAPPDKSVYRIDLTGATDVSTIALPATGTALPEGVKAVTRSAAKLIDMAANTLPELGNKSPEKWEGLTIGPKLSNGRTLLLMGTDNDYSVTQNDKGAQFDVYLAMKEADPYKASIQCPIDQTTNCFFSTGGAPATLTPSYTLLPGVLHAYVASAADLAGYVAPMGKSGQ
jgi:hypothetical protein